MNVQAQELPDNESLALARASAEELSRFLGKLPDAERARVRIDGNELILPRKALALLREVLVEMGQGHAVTIVPTHAELTTQQAANILNVSRPYLVKLLEEGGIPFTKTGVHRRIRYRDLMEYRERVQAASRAALKELAAQAQENDMGY